MKQSSKTKNRKIPSDLIITIDGPAASGKGTVAYRLARKYDLLNLDSGACYRAVAWLAIENNIPVDEAHIPQILQLLDKNPLELKPNRQDIGPKCYVFIGGKDITQHIRTPEVGDAASIVGMMQPVRHVVRQHEQRIANQSKVGIVVEGRDSGTVVFPQAQLKFFLTAAPQERARRRYEEYQVAGKNLSYEQVLAEITERDKRDTERAYSALRIPVDAIVVDSTTYHTEQTVEEFIHQIETYLSKELEEKGKWKD